MKGDEKGEYTYVSQRGCSVIDYVIVNDNGDSGDSGEHGDSE